MILTGMKKKLAKFTFLYLKNVSLTKDVQKYIPVYSMKVFFFQERLHEA